MDNKRRNFKCVFNPYVTEHNKDAVIRSIINQFEGYYAEPEVTQVAEGFIITLTLGDNLSPTMVRDKILWNQFVDSVTAADAIRKIQIIRIPKSGSPNEGTIGGFGPHGSDSGVDEKLNNELPEGHKDPQYTIGPNTDGSLGWHASVHYAHDDLHPWPMTEQEAATHVLDSGHHDEVLNQAMEILGLDREKTRQFLLKNQFHQMITHTALHKNPEEIKRFGKPSHEHDEEPLSVDIPDNVETIIPTTIGVGASVHYADPTGNMLPTIYGPGAEEGEPVDEDIRSDATSIPKVLGVPAFKRVSFQSDSNGAFTLNKPDGFQSVNDPPDQGPLHEKAVPATGIGGGAPISGASWYVTQPGNEQQTDLGTERNKTYDSASSSAPLSGITISSIVSPELNEEDPQQGIKGIYGDTLDVLGVGEHPMGGASYGSVFGLNDYYTYDYESDIDVYDI